MEKEDNTNKKTISNMAWRLAERSGAQVVSFAVSIILARILEPAAFGTVAIITVFTTILFVFVDGGLGNALIQKKDVDNIDFSTVFYTNIVFCATLYIFLFLCAPVIADFYDNDEMTSLIRVSGLTLLLSGIKNVQQAYVAKKLIFKKFFFATLGGTIGSAILGIWMAIAGYGVWALVISGLFNNIVDMIVLWVTVKWRPQIVFSHKRLKGLFSYGSKILAANVMQVIYANMYDLIIGKVYSSADLAYYNKGRQIPNVAVNNVDNSINSVLLPVMSEKQDNIAIIKNMTKRALKINLYIMTPLLFGLASMAEPLIRVLYTEKWMPAVIYLQIFAVIQALRPFATANLSALKAIGRSDIFFYVEILKEAIGICVLLLTVRQGVLAIAIGVLVVSALCVVVNSWPTRKGIGYGLGEQMLDALPALSLSTVMGVAIYIVTFLGFNDIITLLCQITFGGAIYFAGSLLLKIDSFYYLLDTIKKYRT